MNAHDVQEFGGPRAAAPSESDSRQVTPCFIASQYTPYSCAVCNRPAADCKRCSSCKAVSYCSPEHQRANWSSHKKLCKFVTKHVLNGPPLTTSHTPIRVANELFPAFRCESGGGKVSPLNQDALTRLPRCIGCGAYPATEVCKGCGLVGRCPRCHSSTISTTATDDAAALATADSGRLHPTTLCDIYAASARAMRIVIIEASPFFSFGSGSRYRQPATKDEQEAKKKGSLKELHNPLYVFEMVMRAFANESAGTVATFGLGGWRGYENAVHWCLHGTPMARLDGVLDPGMQSLIRDSYSAPLTAFAGIMMAPQWAKEAVEARVTSASGTLVIHVVGAEFEGIGTPAWEAILHLFASWGVSHIAIGFIGPGVMPQVGNCLTDVLDHTEELSDESQASGCTSTAFFYRGSYEAFCGDASVSHNFAAWKRACDVTVTPNAGLHDSSSDTWRAGVEAMVTKNRAPINIMTAYSPEEAVADVDVLERWVGGSGTTGPTDAEVAVSAAQPNPFRSPLFLPDPATIDGWYSPNHTMWCFTVGAPSAPCGS